MELGHLDFWAPIICIFYFILSFAYVQHLSHPLESLAISVCFKSLEYSIITYFS